MNWDLSKLYTGFDAPEFGADMQKLGDEIAAVREMIANVSEENEAAQLREIILRTGELTDLSGRLANMVQLTLSADSNCEAALSPMVRLKELGNELALLDSELTRCIGENPRIEALCEGDEVLAQHKLYFRNCREKCAHLIDPALEGTVLKMTLSGGESWSRLRDELFAGLAIDLELNGEKKRLPLSGVRALACDADPAVRETAYRAELAAYPRIETPMAACLNGIKGEAITLAGLRKYDSVLDESLAASRVDRETLKALLDTMHASLPMFRRYFRLKAKLLGYEGGLKFCDLFAPMGSNAKKYSLKEAEEMLLSVFGACAPSIAATMKRAFDENWIDAYPREGKEGGAFCSDVHGLKMSYVLTNYDGSYSDISTLAHELGHAYQNTCLESEPPLLCDLPMPLAETASTFNELLLSEHMLGSADRDTAIALLDQQVGDAAQVIVDILSRYLFETEVVERRRTGMPTARELCEIMLDAQKQTYGDGLNEEWLHPYMWACKPHYYFTGSHFYNFPYAFGQLFASGLYAMYGKMGADFWPMYDRILRMSGSGTVREVAASAGVDTADPAFWQEALELFSRKVDQLEKLTQES